MDFHRGTRTSLQFTATGDVCTLLLQIPKDTCKKLSKSRSLNAYASGRLQHSNPKRERVSEGQFPRSLTYRLVALMKSLLRKGGTTDFQVRQ